jgi:hypothetical protein
MPSPFVSPPSPHEPQSALSLVKVLTLNLVPPGLALERVFEGWGPDLGRALP